LFLALFSGFGRALFWTTQILHWEETMAKVITQITASAACPAVSKAFFAHQLQEVSWFLGPPLAVGLNYTSFYFVPQF